MRLRRLLLLALAIAAVATSAALPAPPAPGYLSDDYGAVSIQSNALFHGAKMVGPASQNTDFSKAKPEPVAPVWGTSCTPAAQTVSLTRDIWLPGPPNKDASFAYSTYQGGSYWTAVKTIDLVANGKVIVHKAFPPTSGQVTLDAGAAKAFRYGENTVVIRVHKSATPKACNTGRDTLLGVQFALRGHITTDLDIATSPATTYHKITPNQTQSTPFTLTFRNLGPSLVVNGRLHVEICCPTQFVVAGAGNVNQLPAPAPPLSNCKTTQNGSTYDVDCTIVDMAPGTRTSLGGIFEVKGPVLDSGDFNTSISWYVVTTGVTDSNVQNNQGGTKIVFCTSKPNDPGCSAAQ